MSILFLHGYSQSGPLFSLKTKALIKPLLKVLPPSTPLLFPTAPHVLSLSDLPGEPAAEPLDAHGWWRRDPATGRAVGIAATLRFLSSYLDLHGPFLGVIGFSQGAALAALLAAALEPGRQQRPEGLETGHGPLRFCVAYSGFYVPGEEWAYRPKIQTRVLSFVGSLDTVVEEARSMRLVKECAEENVVWHPGGHFAPMGKQWVAVVVGFVAECVKEPLVGGGGGKDEGGVEDMEVPF